MSILVNSLLLPARVGDRLVILILALALDAIIGDPRALYAIVPHPVALIGKAITLFDRRLNRETRTDRARLVRGIVTLLLMILGAGLVGVALSLGAALVPQGWILEMILVAIMVAQRSLFDHVIAVRRALEKNGLEAGRAAVSLIVGRDPGSLDAHAVARAGIESLAENFSDGIVAPVLFYAVAGLPGLIIYKTANTLDSMIGHRSPRYRAFGWASARFDDLLNLVPARLSGLFIALASLFLPRGRPFRALATMLRDARKHRSPNAGWPEAAMAGALDLALAGPRRYGELVVDDPWLGRGRAQATTTDMGRALMLFVVACLIEVLTLAGAALLLAR
jgi:adenosylcobinamide-phosphate synthase